MNTTCDRCDQPAHELTYTGAGMLCPTCHQVAGEDNRAREIPPCVECGTTLAKRPERFKPLNGSFMLDCPNCDRTHVAFIGEPIRPWHDHQPRCECGQYARYHGRQPVTLGRSEPEDVRIYHCRGCGQHLEVRTDRPRFDIPRSEQGLRPPRVRVTKEPS